MDAFQAEGFEFRAEVVGAVVVGGGGEDAFVHGDYGEGLFAEDFNVAFQVSFGLLAAGPGAGGLGSRAFFSLADGAFLVGEVSEGVEG